MTNSPLPDRARGPWRYTPQQQSWAELALQPGATCADLHRLAIRSWGLPAPAQQPPLPLDAPAAR